MVEIEKYSSKSSLNNNVKVRTYADIVEYLDNHWNIPLENNLNRIKKLDAIFDNVSKKVNTILVAGTNGKSITINLATKLLKSEGFKVGSFYSPHILNYNERLSINNENISNKNFTDIANNVLSKIDDLPIQFHSQEILTIMSLLYFFENKVDIAILEVDKGGEFNPVNVCHAKIAAITRVTDLDNINSNNNLTDIIKDYAGIIKENTIVISGDQVKYNLQLIENISNQRMAKWAMPIRKLAPLSYPFEQLHGRCAALAERLSSIYVENYCDKDSLILADSLLIKNNVQRGRPTLEAKKKLELNPKKTLEQFWKEESNELPGRFQILDKEKPTILLDNASNIDAFKNTLLGIRLLHYQKQLKGLVIIVASIDQKLYSEEFVKSIRYFFKKNSGQLFICPIDNLVPGTYEDNSWDIDKVTNDIKSMKIKARSFKSFEDAFEAAKKIVDERNGLIAITGSKSIINKYLKSRGIKKV